MGASCCSKVEQGPKLEANADDKPRKSKAKKNVFTKEELEEAFMKFDLDNSNSMDMPELAELLEFLGVKFNANTLKIVFHAMDDDDSGHIHLPEFVTFFSGKDRKKGLGKAIQGLINKEQLIAAANRAEDKKEFDAYIISAQGQLGAKRMWWLAGVCDFAGFSATGPYTSMPRGGAITVENGKNGDGDGDDEHVGGTIGHCECVVLLATASCTLSQKIIEDLKEAEEHHVPVTIFFEMEDGAIDNLKGWKKKCPYAFQRVPVAISRHFNSDSEQLALTTVAEMGKTEAPILSYIRPPGGDIDEFGELAYDKLKWVLPEFVMVCTPGVTQVDFPPPAFGVPTGLRPCFVSYANEDPKVPGLSESQQAKLRDVLKRLNVGMRVFFIDTVSLSKGTLLDKPEFVDALSLSRYIILDEVSSDAQDKRPFLKRGKCFLEAMIAILTGNLAPHREGQFVSLDKAIGQELEDGLNLRKFFRENMDNKKALINKLCGLIDGKDFDSKKEEEGAEAILRKVLERHPLLNKLEEGTI